MRRREPRKIADAQGDEHVYVVQEFGADEGFDLAMEIVSIVGDAFGPMTRLLVTDQGQFLGQAIMRLATQIQQHGGSTLMKRVLKETTRDGKRLHMTATGDGDDHHWTFNGAYRANYGEMLHAVVFALEVNFASFFAGLSRDLMTRVENLVGKDRPSES